MNRFAIVFSIGMTVLGGGIAAAAPPSSLPAAEELRPRLEVTADTVQDCLEEIGVKGWTLHAGLALASGAQPDLERLRSALDAAVAAWRAHKGTHAAALSARRTLDEHQQAVLTEIGFLLTPAQRLALLFAFTPTGGYASKA